MKNTTRLSILILLVFFSINSWAQKIVYPWRSTTAIVKAGDTFEVWFNADAGQTLNEVSLRGPYSTATVAVTDTKTDTWIYDQWSGNTCNRKYTISVPADTPSERYDLILKTSTGDEISLAAVKVIKEFKTNFYVMHMSDAHRWQGTYDTPNVILREVSTMIDIANIIDPEMFIETGDNHYPNTNLESSTVDRINQYMNGFMNGTDYVNGMNNSFAPVFTVPGNHDTPLKNYQLEPGYPTPGYEKVPSLYYNKHYGLQAQNFTYGNVRFIGLNNSWFPDDKKGTPNFSHQTDAAVNWLNTVGKGSMRIGFCHVNTSEPLYEFNNPLKLAGAPLDLILIGHVHSITYSPYIVDGKKMAYSTLTPREGTRKVPFNLYKIDANTGTYETVGNEQAFQEGIEIAKNYSTVKLKLTYSSLNDGSVGNNTATIINKFNFPITGARVRFVVPKGTPYYLRNATIKQEFDGTNYHIVDATLNLEQSSTTVVSIHAGIQEDLCPLDPNKMDPGICGCGVPEGSCPIPVAEISLKPANSRINVNTTRQLVATISPLSATNKAVLWESSTPSVAAINAFGKVTALAEGTTTITATTVDGAKTSSAAITVLPNNSIYQAEDAEFVGAAVSTEQSGFRGAGYIDYVNSSNDFIKWTVFVEEAGTYALSFRYGLASGNRPLKLTVNEEVRIASTVFPATGTWTNWSTFLTNQVLEQGINTITLTATGASGGNIDELSLKNTALGLNDLKLNQGGRKVKIAPNPISKGVLTVSTDGFEDDTNIRVKISNTNGQTIYQNAITDTCHTDINLSGKLSNALYFVTVESDQSKITNKLIVKQ